MGAHERNAARLNGRFNFLGFIHCQAKRFLDEHVLLGVRRRHRGVFVHVMGQTDVHRVYVGVLQQLVVIGIDLSPAHLSRARLRGCVNHVRYCDHFGAVVIGVPAARMAVADTAAPDNANT